MRLSDTYSGSIIHGFGSGSSRGRLGAYEDRNILERKRLYTEEGTQHYSGNLLIPNDLESLEL